MGKQFYLSLSILCVVFWHGISASSDRKSKNEEDGSSSSRSQHRQIIRHPENPPKREHPYLRPNSHPNLHPNVQPHPNQNPPSNLYKLDFATPFLVKVIVNESELRLSYAINPFIVLTHAGILQGYQSVRVLSPVPQLLGNDISHNVINVRINENYTKNNKLYDVALLEVQEAIVFNYRAPGILDDNVEFSPVALEFACTMAKELLEMRLGKQVPHLLR